MNTHLGMTTNKLARIANGLDVENTKLRKENERLIIKLNAEHIVRQNVEHENAKLRELVKKLNIFSFARCSECDLLADDCYPNPTQKCLLWVECESIARDLGVGGRNLRNVIHSTCRDAREDSSSA